MELNGDSTWNFHVWVEAWFARDDIAAVYSGWQVIDSTPQEQSEDKYQTGPGSKVAIRRGDVDMQHDLHFIWAETSALTITWVEDPSTPLGWKRTRVTEEETGLQVLTKAVGVDAEHDITSEYKFTDKDERLAALKNGKQRCGLSRNVNRC